MNTRVISLNWVPISLILVRKLRLVLLSATIVKQFPNGEHDTIMIPTVFTRRVNRRRFKFVHAEGGGGAVEANEIERGERG